MDNYFTSFRLLTHPGGNNIPPSAQGKNRLRKCTIVGEKQRQKRDMVTLNSAQQSKK